MLSEIHDIAVGFTFDWHGSLNAKAFLFFLFQNLKGQDRD